MIQLIVNDLVHVKFGNQIGGLVVARDNWFSRILRKPSTSLSRL